MKVEAKVNFDGLLKLQEAFSEEFETKVGILSEKNARQDEGGDVTNADLGLIHEFGSFTKNIPARSWLRMPIEQKKEDIQNFILRGADQIKDDLANGKSDSLYEKLGVGGEAVIQDAFATRGFGMWRPNAPSTIKAKGSSSPLIDSGELRGSILSKVVKRSGS